MPLLSAAGFREMVKRKTADAGRLSTALTELRDDVIEAADFALSDGALIDIFPSTNVHRALGKLCRCRGMIQEVNPEMTLFPVSRRRILPDPEVVTSKSIADDEEGSDEEELVDAVLLYVIPVPGNTHFYEVVEDSVKDDDQSSDEAATLSSHEGQLRTLASGVVQSRKRTVDQRGPPVGSNAERSHPSGASALPAQCRNALDGRSTAASRMEEEEEEGVTASRSGTAPLRLSAGSEIAHAPVPVERHLNHPHPPRAPGLQASCIVTVLLPSEQNARASLLRDGLCTNAVIDFFGFLHFPDDQTEPGVLEDDEFAQFSSWHVAELTKGLVSRLICLAYRPVLAPLSTQPALDYFVTTRALTLNFLSRELCRGDELLSEYMLLHLSAHVSAHSDVTPVGDVPLLVCSTQIEAAQWSAVLQYIAPIAEILLNRDILDAAGDRVHPKQDMKLNYLRTGLLQLGNGTHITVDCHHLEDTAERAHLPTEQRQQWPEALFGVVHRQLLPLDYSFHTVELAVDLAFLALAAITPTAKAPNTFNFPLRVNWEPTSQAGDEERSAGDVSWNALHEKKNAAAAVRRYLETVQRFGVCFAEDDDDASEHHANKVTGVRTHITEAFVNLSKECDGWNNRDPLIHNNTFSAVTALIRATSASFGREKITHEDVDRVVALERQRAARLSLPAAD